MKYITIELNSTDGPRCVGFIEYAESEATMEYAVRSVGLVIKGMYLGGKKRRVDFLSNRIKLKDPNDVLYISLPSDLHPQKQKKQTRKITRSRDIVSQIRDFIELKS